MGVEVKAITSKRDGNNVWTGNIEVVEPKPEEVAPKAAVPTA